MPALNFKPQFAGLVQTGKKTQTIRAPRVHPIKVGDRLILSVGARTKNYRQIGEGVATEVVTVRIDAVHGESEFEGMSYNIYVNGEFLEPHRAEEFARADGFKTGMEMCRWFEKEHGFPFIGYLIRWRLTTAP